MSFGVTPAGYVLKTQAEVNAETEASLLEVKDPITGDSLQVDLESSDITAQVTLIPVEGVGTGLAENQVAYDQFDPSKNTGAAQSGTVQLNGILRKEATASTVLLDFTGTPSAAILASEVTVTDQNSENNWKPDADFAIDGFGNATGIAATCQTLGANKATVGTLTALVNPLATITTVINPADATIGTAEETDTQLRARQINSTEVPSVGQPASVQAAVLDSPNVTFARVYNNNFPTTSPEGIPPKSVAPVVVGGTDEEAAKIIFSRVGMGPDYFGNTTVQFQDRQGIVTAVSFIRPTEIPIYVAVTISIIESDVYPANGAETIKENIVLYSIGGAPAIGVTDGFEDVGFQPGSDIIQPRLYTPVNSVPGHRIDSIFIGKTPAPTLPNDVAIAYNELGVFDTSRISVTVV